jgi:predicted transcriptional regulator YheO
VLVHELSDQAAEHSIVAIENGHVTGRSLGDGPSQVVLEQLSKHQDANSVKDRYGYLTRTPDGKLLKSTTMHIRDESGAAVALLCINFDVSALALANSTLADLVRVEDHAQTEPAQIPTNVNDLLDALIDRSVRMVGKPVEMMTKEDKVKAIRFLSDSGAMLITKSGDKIARFFGISKYTLYSYLVTKQEEKNND